MSDKTYEVIGTLPSKHVCRLPGIFDVSADTVVRCVECDTHWILRGTTLWRVRGWRPARKREVEAARRT